MSQATQRIIQIIETTYVRHFGEVAPIEHEYNGVIYVFRLPPNVTKLVVREGERNG